MFLFQSVLLLTLTLKPPYSQSQQQNRVDSLLERFSSSDILRVQLSRACGGSLGVFANRDIPPNQLLAEIPVGACVTTSTDISATFPTMQALLDEYLASDGGQGKPMATRGSITKEGIVVATKLLLLRKDSDMNKNIERRKQDHQTWQRTYVDSLPWSSMNHPLVDPNRPNPGYMWHSVRQEATEIMNLLQRGETAASKSLCFQDCLQSIALVRSRAFQLSKCLEGQPRCAMVPLLDLFNHPSQIAVSFYGDDKFLQTPISQATIAWNVKAADRKKREDHSRTLSLPSPSSSSQTSGFVIHVHSPKGFVVSKGSELWNWYGDGGHVSDPERRKQGILWDSAAHEAFVEMYGFDPWAKASS